MVKVTIKQEVTHEYADATFKSGETTEFLFDTIEVASKFCEMAKYHEMEDRTTVITITL